MGLFKAADPLFTLECLSPSCTGIFHVWVPVFFGHLSCFGHLCFSVVPVLYIVQCHVVLCHFTDDESCIAPETK